MNKYVTILFTLFYLSNQVKILTYDKAGEYVLTPLQYDNADNILIQLWGAGSGSFMYHDQIETLRAGGNSGAFIMMSLDTTKKENFYFTLGVGGNCSLSYSLPGNYSLFYNEDHSLFLNVSGGYGSTEYSSSNKKATVTILNYRANDLVLHNIDGDVSITTSSNYGGRGSSSAYGSYGGYFYDTNRCNGYMGSGAGYGCNTCVSYGTDGYCSIYYKGGDGALLVYF